MEVQKILHEKTTNLLENKKKLKICLAASAGGHMTQLLKLAQSWKEYETFYVTTTDVMREKLRTCGRVYVVGECNHKHLLKVVKVFMQCIRLILQERPDVVMSTGAAAGCMACFIAKTYGAKIIWLDSITNIGRLSLSGRMVRYIADLFLTQWPDLAEKYKNVGYAGAVA